MSESARIKAKTPGKFDNLVFKQWLHGVGSIHRYKVLTKLREQLQNLGLSNRQIRRGLIQLATKPQVIVTQKLPVRRRRPRRLFINENGCQPIKVSINLKDDTKNFPGQSESILQHVQGSNTVDTTSKKTFKQNKQVDNIKLCKVETTCESQEVIVSLRNSKLEANTQTKLHSFDKVLEKLDMLNCPKMNAIEELKCNKNSRSESIYKWKGCTNNKKSPSIKKPMCNTDENFGDRNQKDTNSISRKANNSNSNEVLLDNKLTQDKKHCTKVNLSPSSIRKEKKDIRAESMSNKVNHSTKENDVSKISSHESPEKNCTKHDDEKTESAIKNLHKRKLVEIAPDDFVQKRKNINSKDGALEMTNKRKRKKTNSKGDAPEMINKRKKKTLKVFRKYFGNCLSVSEDEQEQTILYKNCKRTTYKNSVDSCDSGVCFNKENIAANYEETSVDAQTTVPESVEREEFTEDVFEENHIETDVTNTPQKENNTNENDKRANGTENTTDINQIENTCIEIENSTNTETESSKSKNGIAESNTPFEKDKTTEEISDNNNTIRNIYVEYVNDVLKRIYHEPPVETEKRTSPISCDTLEAYSGECDVQNLSTINLDDIREDNLINYDVNEFLLSFVDTCQITTNGNVLSIKENNSEDTYQSTVKKVVNSSTDKNSILNTVEEKKANSDRDEENSVQPLRETVIMYDSRLKTNTASIDKTVCNTFDSLNETTSENCQSKDALEEERNQPNQSTQARLRVLSSAELGSRWCPTPVNSNTDCIDLSSNNLAKYVTPVPLLTSVSIPQTAPMVSKNFSKPATIPPMPSATPNLLPKTVPLKIRASTFTAPVVDSIPKPTTTNATASFNNSKEYSLDSQTLESMRKALLTICDLVQSVRSSLPSMPITRYDKLLYTEFDKLRQLMASYEFSTILCGTVNLINNKVFTLLPLTIKELFCYTPTLGSLMTRIPRKYITSCNDTYSNFYCNLNRTTAAVNKPVSNHAQQNPANKQTRLQDSTTANVIPQQSSVHLNSTAGSAKHVRHQQSLVDMVTTPPYNVTQNNAPTTNMDPPAINKRSRKRGQKPAQRVPKQQQVPNPPVNISQPARYTYTSPPNAYVNQPYIARNPQMLQMNGFYTVPPAYYPVPQNVSPAYTAQQQNVNFPYNVQQQNINLPHTPSQNVYPTSQQFQKTVHIPTPYVARHGAPSMRGAPPTHGTTPTQGAPPTHGTTPTQGAPPTHGTQQQSSQNVSLLLNYLSQKVFGPSSHPPISRNVKQNEQMYQKAPLQSTMKVSQNIPLDPKVPLSSPYSQKIAKPTVIENNHLHSKDRGSKTEKAPQVSLESTAGKFSILKHLSDIEKIILLGQLNFYFSCTTWLEKEFSQAEWQMIESQRSILLSCRTLLQNTVDKIMNDPLIKNQPKICENSCINVKIDIPKEGKISVQAGAAIHCKVDVINTDKGQSKVTDNVAQQNLNVSTVQKEHEEEPTKTVTKENTDCTLHLQKLMNMVNQKVEKTNIQGNILPQIVSRSEITFNPKSLKDETEKKTQNSMKEQYSGEPKNMFDSSTAVVEDKTLDPEESKKDMSEQLNSHLVTVEISPNSDHVMVVDNPKAQKISDDMSEVVEIEPTEDNDYFSLSAKDAMPEVSPELLPFKDSDIDSECSQDTDIEEVGQYSARITDVRNISLEAFNEMKICCTSAIVEEEEIKVCLYCSKLSTVVCAICLEAKYCSKECSQLHWQEHYKTCNPVEKSVHS